MSAPSFTADASLYAGSQHYRSAAISVGGNLDSVLAQQLCRHLGQSWRHRSVLLSRFEVHGAARRARHLRIRHFPLLAMRPRPAVLLSTPRLWHRLFCPAVPNASMMFSQTYSTEAAISHIRASS
jgi:hypothetical protein